VIGAGLSGACVAHALALRGWEVSVFEQEAAAARGASGLPVGLGVPHVSADDSPRSRLSRAGLHLMAQLAQRLLRRGYDWAPSGVEERRPHAPALWHARAFWMKPAMMVQALLGHDAISLNANSAVARLVRVGTQWCVHGAQGQNLGCFDLVVLANAMGAVPLLVKGLPPEAALTPELQVKLADVHAVHGTVSHGTYAEVLPGLPASPVNGHGCFIPHVPGPTGDQWLTGATFESDFLAAADLASQHAHNMRRLRELLPMTDYDLPDTLDRGPVAQWTSTRCVTHDRLPLVGPIDTAQGTGLWLCMGMGSRGLSFAALCAELLAARLGGEPLPVPGRLARSLDVDRVRRKPVAAPAV
jgi:tRNA 5-methylaminomethyl-2-thiouridine biosynthesis bifunctional protein